MYAKIPYLLKTYASSTGDDRRAVENFMYCEGAETVSSLRAELTGILQCRAEDSLLDKLVGPDRKARHGTYQEWAKLMLLWMASHKG